MDPIAFTIFGIDIRWYGILIAAAMMLGIIISYKRAESYHIAPDRVLDFALITLPVAIIGARVYYVVFNLDYYQRDFYKMINTRDGGLAIHGGIIFGILIGLVLCKLWTIHPWDALDLFAPVIALGQAIGRWGNYFNGEAYGAPTTLPWAIEINGVMVHPTFLYESIWCFLLFGFLLLISRQRKFSGQIFLLYGMLYSVERFFVEWLRTDSLLFFGFKTAQILSLVIIFSFFFIYRYRKKHLPDQLFYRQ